MTLQTLWNIDPGYFRLKHAAKTILAILITLWLLQDEPRAFKLMAGIATGFSMQGVVAISFFSRLVQIVVLDTAYCLTFILGLLVRDSAGLSACLLVVVGFVANYVRRFGLKTSVAPMMGWSLCFFATVLPFANTSQVWSHMYGLILALLVSALVNGFVFPENYPRLFVSNSNRLFNVLAKGMREIRRYVLNVNAESGFDEAGFTQIMNTLSRLLESNQAMGESEFFVDEDNKLGDILLQQYALVHSFMMMIDAYHALLRHHHQLSRPARRGLSQIYSRFEKLFASMTMQPDYSVKSRIALVSFAKPLAYTQPSEPAVIIVLLNLKLSFNLFNRHIASLIRGADAT